MNHLVNHIPYYVVPLYRLVAEYKSFYCNCSNKTSEKLKYTMSLYEIIKKTKLKIRKYEVMDYVTLFTNKMKNMHIKNQYKK